MAKGGSTPEARIAAAEHRRQVVLMRIRGVPFEAIGRQLGFSKVAAYKHYKSALEATPRALPEPVAAMLQAGERLGHVHLDDNDGEGDLHWPLLTGRLTADHLEGLARALRDVGFRGGLTLELNPKIADPIGALQEGKAIVERLLLG